MLVYKILIPGARFDPMLARCRATLGRKAAGLLSWRREHPSLYRTALLKQGHLGVGWTQVRIQLSISQQELIGHLLLREAARTRAFLTTRRIAVFDRISPPRYLGRWGVATRRLSFER